MTRIEVNPAFENDRRKPVREKVNEQKLTRMVKAAGGIALKFVSPGFDGMPDRLVLLPGGHIAFVEVKAPGEKPRPLQLARHRLLRCLGFRVFILDDAEQIGGIIDEIRGA
jgi:hypothetical protein